MDLIYDRFRFGWSKPSSILHFSTDNAGKTDHFLNNSKLQIYITFLFLVTDYIKPTEITKPVLEDIYDEENSSVYATQDVIHENVITAESTSSSEIFKMDRLILLFVLFKIYLGFV